MIAKCSQACAAIPEISNREVLKDLGKEILYVALIAIALYGASRCLQLQIGFRAHLGGALAGITTMLFIDASFKYKFSLKNKYYRFALALFVLTAVGLIIADRLGGISIHNFFSVGWRGIICGATVTLFVIRRFRLKEKRLTLKEEYDLVEKHKELANMSEICKKIGLFVLYGALLAGTLYGGVRLFGRHIDFATHGGGLLCGSIFTLCGAGAIYTAWKYKDIKRDSLLKKIILISSLGLLILFILGATNKIPMIESMRGWRGILVGHMFTVTVMKLVFDDRRRAKMERLIKRNQDQDPRLWTGGSTPDPQAATSFNLSTSQRKKMQNNPSFLSPQDLPPLTFPRSRPMSESGTPLRV